MHKVFTPKGLHNIAQGRERSERTLGNVSQTPSHPERVEQTVADSSSTLSG
jgi:hypothetical protein